MFDDDVLVDHVVGNLGIDELFAFFFKFDVDLSIFNVICYPDFRSFDRVSEFEIRWLE